VGQVVVFAWSALLVFTVATAALLVLLSKAMFASLDKVDRVRDEVFSMAKTLETLVVRMERIESDLGGGDQRMDELRADLRASVRRDLREFLDTPRQETTPR
jgi:hypothetical protein